jgi:hypothetical protein
MTREVEAKLTKTGQMPGSRLFLVSGIAMIGRKAW